MRLQAGYSSRSFAKMRVEVVENLEIMPRATERVVPDAAASLAIKNFLAALDSGDSLFCMAHPLAGPAADDSAGTRIYSGDIVVEFRESQHSRQRSLHFLLVEKLAELLQEAGSRESLVATICLTKASISVGKHASDEEGVQKELALWIRLSAIGDSEGQAVLRWGLGLAHIQQALLFTSRHLRLHLTHTEG